MNLPDFLKRYGQNTTSNFQLTKYARELKIPNFHICMRDEIAGLPRTTFPLNVITNIHTSAERGVHWSAFYISKTCAYFFDSYGLPPTQEIIDFIKAADRTCNSLQVQDFNTTHCGQLSLYVLYRLSKGDRFEDVIISLLKNKEECQTE